MVKRALLISYEIYSLEATTSYLPDWFHTDGDVNKDNTARSSLASLVSVATQTTDGKNCVNQLWPYSVNQPFDLGGLEKQMEKLEELLKEMTAHHSKSNIELVTTTSLPMPSICCYPQSSSSQPNF